MTETGLTKSDMTETGLTKSDMTENGLTKSDMTENELTKSDMTENEYIRLCMLHRMIEMKLCTTGDVSMFPQLLVPSAVSSHSRLTITL